MTQNILWGYTYFKQNLTNSISSEVLKKILKNSLNKIPWDIMLTKMSWTELWTAWKQHEFNYWCRGMNIYTITAQQNNKLILFMFHTSAGDIICHCPVFFCGRNKTETWTQNWSLCAAAKEGGGRLQAFPVRAWWSTVSQKLGCSTEIINERHSHSWLLFSYNR